MIGMAVKSFTQVLIFHYEKDLSNLVSATSSLFDYQRHEI